MADKITGLSQQQVEELLRQYGYNETNEKKRSPWKLFLKKFWNLSAWMLEGIILISLIIQNYSDAAVVGCFLLANSIITFLQDYKASDAAELLKQKLSISVQVLRDNEWKTIPARELVPGDVARLRTGDFVPADLKLIEGSITVDQSSLTGESGGIKKNKGDDLYSGSVIIEGETTAKVGATGIHTYYGKTIDLLKTASPKSHVDEVIANVIKWLSWVIGGMLLLAIIISLVKGISILSILPVMVILFMNAIPVGLTVMFSVNNAIGARQLLKEGVLVTRMNAPNDAASMDILCVDKTGTLTMNDLSVAGLFPADGCTDRDVLLYGVQASHTADRDAIDMAFIKEGKKQNIDTGSFTQQSFSPFTPQNRHTEAVIRSGQEEYTVYKGSFEVIVKLTGMTTEEISGWQKQIHDAAAKGYRTLAVGKGASGKPVQLVGIATLFDPPREDAGELIGELKEMDIDVMLLTGDALPIATEIARKTGIGTRLIKASELKEEASLAEQLEQCDGIAEVYPEDKYKIVKALQAKGHIVGMTGDGVNDAPALKQAEVGVAVHNAADVAKSAASIILTQDGLQGILSPVRLGRVTFERFNIWMLNKLSRTLLKVCFIVLALILFSKYVVSTTVLLLLLLVTDFVFISTSNNQVHISNKPDEWNIPKLAFTGAIQGVLMSVEALGLLAIGWHFFGLAEQPGQLYTFSYITLLFFSLMVVFVIREKRHFWSSAPGRLDLLLLVGNFLIGFVISFTGLVELKPIPWWMSLFVFGYVAFMCLLVNDFIKFWSYKSGAHF
ncbi:MAG: plasma-membrane proton-efflux P-type ATPase [Tannerellaceae bacterium]|nr:plasma-membrane proton-efflux P-type ATPase [Tannerellaceae bacterium]